MDANIIKESFQQFDPTCSGKIQKQYLPELVRTVGLVFTPDELAAAEKLLVVKGNIDLIPFTKYVLEQPQLELSSTLLRQQYLTLKGKNKMSLDDFVFVLKTVNQGLTDKEIQFIKKHVLVDVEYNGEVSVDKLISKMLL